MIQQLLLGRAAVDNYMAAIIFKGLKTETDSMMMHDNIKAAGFQSLDDFYARNLLMNLQEADRCYRFRRQDAQSTPFLCDGCAGRSTTMCITSCSGGGTVGMPWVRSFDRYSPESLMVTEQFEKASHDGITLLFWGSPICYFLMHDVGGTVPGYCRGVFVEVSRPQFDIFWRMENYLKYGAEIVENMNKANEVA